MLKLYARETSGNAYKIRLLLTFLDIPHERIPVSSMDGRNQVDDAYLKLNPRGQIPTIQEDEFSLWGSTAILCYLASRYDKTACWLPLDPAHQAAGQALGVLESRLGAAQWLAGSAPTIADIACFPYVALAGEGRVDTSQYVGVCRWIADFKALDRFVGMPGI